jgi:hypothetical protein
MMTDLRWQLNESANLKTGLIIISSSAVLGTVRSKTKDKEATPHRSVGHHQAYSIFIMGTPENRGRERKMQKKIQRNDDKNSILTFQRH